MLDQNKCLVLQVEHSACPVLAGHKWIATQWYWNLEIWVTFGVKVWSKIWWFLTCIQKIAGLWLPINESIWPFCFQLVWLTLTLNQFNPQKIIQITIFRPETRWDFAQLTHLVGPVLQWVSDVFHGIWLSDGLNFRRFPVSRKKKKKKRLVEHHVDCFNHFHQPLVEKLSCAMGAAAAVERPKSQLGPGVSVASEGCSLDELHRIAMKFHGCKWFKHISGIFKPWVLSGWLMQVTDVLHNGYCKKANATRFTVNKTCKYIMISWSRSWFQWFPTILDGKPYFDICWNNLRSQPASLIWLKPTWGRVQFQSCSAMTRRRRSGFVREKRPLWDVLPHVDLMQNAMLCLFYSETWNCCISIGYV